MKNKNDKLMTDDQSIAKEFNRGFQEMLDQPEIED